MSDYESIPLDADDTPEDDAAQANRPAEGARQATPSEMGEESWSAAGEGGDFLGLEADLVADPAAPEAPPQPAPYATAEALEAPDPAYESAYSTSYASEAEYADGGIGGEYTDDPTSFGPGEAGDEEEEWVPTDGTETPRRNPAGVLITVGMALGMGAIAVVAMDYFGLVDKVDPTEVARTDAVRTVDGVDRTPAGEVPFEGTTEGTAEGTAEGTFAETDLAPSEAIPGDPITPTAPTWSEDATEAPAFEEGQDPLLDKLLAGEELSEVDAVGFEETTTSAGDSGAFGSTEGLVDWATVESDGSPFGTVARWFAPDPEPGTIPSGGTVALGGETSPTTAEGGTAAPDETATGTVALGGEPVGPETPDTDALAVPEPEDSDTIAERSGLAVFDELTLGAQIPRSRAADDLSKMDVVWRGEEVPFDMVASVAKIWTPQVGEVRVTTRRGEVFEGRLTAVGKRRVWLGGEYGEMALDGDTVEVVERMPDVVDTDTPGDLASATGRRVKATSPGGTFEGTVLSVHGSQVTLVTDSGGRITLTEPSIEPVREGIQVKVKTN